MDGMIAFLGSFGLFMAFLICAFGITSGRLTLHPSPIFTGFSIFTGCAFVGTFVIFLFVMLVTLEERSLLLIGFLLAAVMLMEYKYRPRSYRSARMLILFSVTFINILLAVQCCYNASNPRFGILFPFTVILLFITKKIAFQEPRGSILLSFTTTVVLTGLVLGYSTDKYYYIEPLHIEMANILNSLVCKMVLLTGFVGALAGSSVAFVWIEQEANGLSSWICCPVAVILYNFDIISHVLGLEAGLGLIMGFAVASGFSFGLVFKHAQVIALEILLIMFVVLGFVFHYFISANNLFIMATIVLFLGSLNTLGLLESVPLEDVAWDFAILAKVMMGSTVLGLAGLLTWPLGYYTFPGLVLALGVVSWNAVIISSQENLLE